LVHSEEAGVSQQITRLPTTAPGTHTEAFQFADWGLLVAIATIWGSSFLFIEIGIETFAPAVVALARLVLGMVALAVVPRARRSVERHHLPRIALLGILWMGVPLILFPLAQRSVDSSVAGMINGALPLFSALVASLLLQRLPGPWQSAGLIVGFIGVVGITLPNARGAGASGFGVALLLLAVMCYGVAANLAVPLQQRYGSLPVLLRAQLFAIAVVLPFGVAGVFNSSWSWAGALAMVPLGLLGTGLAFVAAATLVGRVGAPRGAVAIYFVPVVAIVLGLVVLDEEIAPVALAGTALVLVGAWLTSRRELVRAEKMMRDGRPVDAPEEGYLPR
jgi:drug/metabolite transporter (DMT)-like permease